MSSLSRQLGKVPHKLHIHPSVRQAPADARTLWFYKTLAMNGHRRNLQPWLMLPVFLQPNETKSLISLVLKRNSALRVGLERSPVLPRADSSPGVSFLLGPLCSVFSSDFYESQGGVSLWRGNPP